MKVISSSPYAPFNSKEWNSLISKNVKFENTPIKIQKKFYRTFTLKKTEKDETFAREECIAPTNATCIRIEKY